jgi:hypothetical protein
MSETEVGPLLQSQSNCRYFFFISYRGVRLLCTVYDDIDTRKQTDSVFQYTLKIRIETIFAKAKIVAFIREISRHTYTEDEFSFKHLCTNDTV